MIIIVKFIKYKRGNIVINFILVTIISALSIFTCFIKENNMLVVDDPQIEPVAIKNFYSASLASNIVVPFTLKVIVDSKELIINSTEKNVALMLKAEKINLSATDRVSPPLDTELSDGMEITITRVKIQTIKKTEPIPFKTITKNDNNTLKSKSKVTQIGKLGEKSVIYNVTYENEKEVTKKSIKETVIKKPQNKIVSQGTLKAITFSRGGSVNASENIINVKATAYCPIKGVTNTYTASGLKATRNPDGYSTIAVDPKIIPMGTKLYVEGYGYAIAADKGSAIKGKFIDVYFNTLNEALDFGVKNIKVLILD